MNHNLTSTVKSTVFSRLNAGPRLNADFVKTADF